MILIGGADTTALDAALVKPGVLPITRGMPGTIHAVLTDTLTQKPAAGLRLQVYWVEAGSDVLLRAASTNAAGTTASPLIEGAKMSAGVYKLVLHVGDYLHHHHPDAPRCLDVLPVVFVVDDAAVGRRLEIAFGPAAYDVRVV